MFTEITLLPQDSDFGEESTKERFSREEWTSKCSLCSRSGFNGSCTGITVSAYRGNRMSWKEFALQASTNDSSEYLHEMNFQCVRAGAEIK